MKRGNPGKQLKVIGYAFSKAYARVDGYIFAWDPGGKTSFYA